MKFKILIALALFTPLLATQQAPEQKESFAEETADFLKKNWDWMGGTALGFAVVGLSYALSEHFKKGMRTVYAKNLDKSSQNPDGTQCRQTGDMRFDRLNETRYFWYNFFNIIFYLGIPATAAFVVYGIYKVAKQATEKDSQPEAA